ncbi:MAG: hypothetical protein C4332_15845 [Meiothermus sp.]
MPKVSFVSLELPEIGVPSEVPEIPDAVYQERFRRLEAAREGAGLDALALYADREHAANLGWLTGSTPASRRRCGFRSAGGRRSCWRGTSA